jgi:hypothetical protein
MSGQTLLYMGKGLVSFSRMLEQLPWRVRQAWASALLPEAD